MAWTDRLTFSLPFLPDYRSYQVPWVQFRTPEGDWAEGPMVRQGAHRREILTWTDRTKAVQAARDLVLQTGGDLRGEGPGPPGRPGRMPTVGVLGFPGRCRGPHLRRFP